VAKEGITPRSDRCPCSRRVAVGVIAAARAEEGRARPPTMFEAVIAATCVAWLFGRHHRLVALGVDDMSCCERMCRFRSLDCRRRRGP